jgi:hypothetical protein
MASDISNGLPRALLVCWVFSACYSSRRVDHPGLTVTPPSCDGGSPDSPSPDSKAARDGVPSADSLDDTNGERAIHVSVEGLPSRKPGRQSVLVTVTNKASSDLVLGSGDWIKSYTVSGDTVGIGSARGVFDGIRPGGRGCPSPDYSMFIPSGSTVGRVQEFDTSGIGKPVDGTIHIQIIRYFGIQECGPVSFITRKLAVKF